MAGDPVTRAVAEDLGGDVVEVADADRAAYHAAAIVAANHLVALMGQVERVAATAGLPLEAFAGLMRAASEDAFALGPRQALTGPAARGDWATVERHRSTIAGMPAHARELAAYDAMVALARRLSLDTAAELGTTEAVSSVGRPAVRSASVAARPPPSRWREPAPATAAAPGGRRGPLAEFSVRAWTRPTPGRGGRWAWCPPWGPSTPATPR